MIKRSIDSREHYTRALWSKSEARLWTITLFIGTCLLYAARVSLPICAAAVAKEYGWTKADSGTVLSSFFWGYAMTQLVAGGIADTIGGERVLPYFTLGWTILTFFTPQIFDFSYGTSIPITLLIIMRVMTGVIQAFHVPSMASMVSCHLTSIDKGRVFGIVLAGSHCGTVLAGSVGSLLLDMYGWRSIFRFIGVMSLFWYYWLYYVLSKQSSKHSHRDDSDEEDLIPKKEIVVSEPFSIHTILQGSLRVPWGILFKHPAFWAAAVAQYTGGNAYFTMFNWLPSYFHDTFPEAKGVVYNVVPSLAIVVTSMIAPYMATKLQSNGHTTTWTRRFMEGASLTGMAICLLIVPSTSSFSSALLVFTAAMAFRGIHHGGVSVNPHDFAPNHTGAVFGIFNACGAITGFIGVYVAGHILEETGNNWTYVFIITSIQCIIGAIVYGFNGTGNQII